MSSTNRGSKRIESNFYPTPIGVIKNFLQYYKLKNWPILEPCAGNGNFIKAIRDCGYNNYIIANEIRMEEKNNLINSGADEVYHYDFLRVNFKQIPYTIITNPPYSLAEQFLEKIFNTYPESEVIMLLRLAFLESKKRYNFWQRYPVNKLYILSKRPSFIGGKTDSAAYAWFIWDKTDKQEIKVI